MEPKPNHIGTTFDCELKIACSYPMEQMVACGRVFKNTSGCLKTLAYDNRVIDMRTDTHDSL